MLASESASAITPVDRNRTEEVIIGLQNNLTQCLFDNAAQRRGSPTAAGTDPIVAAVWCSRLFGGLLQLGLVATSDVPQRDDLNRR